jgi:hypothetical protein
MHRTRNESALWEIGLVLLWLVVAILTIQGG